MMSSDPHLVALESQALKSSPGFVVLSGWSSIALTGRDRQAFLHNFCTNDIRRLSPEESCEAFITDVKGRILGHGLVTCREAELVFITVPGQAASLGSHFERYVIREDVQIQDTTPQRSYVLLTSRDLVVALAPTPDEGNRFLNPLTNAAGHLASIPAHWSNWPLLGPHFCGLLEVATSDMPSAEQALVQSGATRHSEAAFHSARIEAGMPLFGVDFDQQNFPQEVGRDREAISFTKGCYLGQETIARIDALGHVNQRLVGLRFDGHAVPSPGLELSSAGKNAGRVTSATFSARLNAPLALGMVRREANSPGMRLESPIGQCETIPLPIGD